MSDRDLTKREKDTATSTIAALEAGVYAPQHEWSEVTQTILATDEIGPRAVYGNCWQAAIASMLKLPLDAVPHFSQFTWAGPALELWLRGRGLTYRHEITNVIPDRLCLVNGHSPRGYLHSTVGFGGQVVWDPHPSHAGLVDVTEIEWFEPWPDGDRTCLACGADKTPPPVEPPVLSREKLNALVDPCLDDMRTVDDGHDRTWATYDSVTDMVDRFIDAILESLSQEGK